MYIYIYANRNVSLALGFKHYLFPELLHGGRPRFFRGLVFSSNFTISVILRYTNHLPDVLPYNYMNLKCPHISCIEYANQDMFLHINACFCT